MSPTVAASTMSVRMVLGLRWIKRVRRLVIALNETGAHLRIEDNGMVTKKASAITVIGSVADVRRFTREFEDGVG